MSKLPAVQSVADIRRNQDPFLDAWILHFMTENNLEFFMNPLINASQEQLAFMVDKEEDQVYVPCSDDLFRELLKPKLSDVLLESYLEAWRTFWRLVRSLDIDTTTRKRIIQFARHRFRLALATNILIPSRLYKRLASIVQTQAVCEDPYKQEKQVWNRRAQNMLWSPEMERTVNACPLNPPSCRSLDELRWELDELEMKRLLVLSTCSELWDRAQPKIDVEALEREVSKPWPGFSIFQEIFGPHHNEGVRVLYLPDTSGGVLFDIRIISALLRQGHKVVLALKDGFHFHAPTIWDMEDDHILARALEGAHVYESPSASKNELLRSLREHRFLVISDGTRERMNLYRVSVTFARAWKEADVIIAKGRSNYRRLIETDSSFTRDILCFYQSREKNFRFEFKAKPGHVRKFTEHDLDQMADGIIESMRIAKHQGKTCMFYSAVIGSIPGETSEAIKIVTTFVDHLREKLDSVFIINPSEHFSPGLDGDDLMYMWERVQRSGLLDVWRFQTVTDIEESFSLRNQRVPSIWSGRDSTYSTGCTKEMHIALDVQKQHPEMQIIGPSPEKFFRRREYGVGKYFDAVING